MSFVKSIPFRIAFILSATVLGSYAGPVFADTGAPTWWIQSLSLSGQDVNVEVGTDSKNLGLPYDLSIVRENEDGDSVTGINVLLTEDDAYEKTLWACSGYSVDPPVCEGDPASCYDCDEDDIPECKYPCMYRYYYFLLSDECVQPGTWSYLYSDVFGDYEKSILVTNTGDSCLDVGTSDVDSDADADSDGSSCSVASAGSDHEPGGLVALLLFCVGGLALAVSRRRRG
jgi:hypothetical protein